MAILIVLLVLEYGFEITLPKIPSLIINLIAWLFAGHKVLRLAFRKAIRGDFFNEFTLMSIATIGAFILGEYQEGVAVMGIVRKYSDTIPDKSCITSLCYKAASPSK